MSTRLVQPSEIRARMTPEELAAEAAIDAERYDPLAAHPSSFASAGETAAAIAGEAWQWIMTGGDEVMRMGQPHVGWLGSRQAMFATVILPGEPDDVEDLTRPRVTGGDWGHAWVLVLTAHRLKATDWRVDGHFGARLTGEGEEVPESWVKLALSDDPASPKEVFRRLAAVVSNLYLGDGDGSEAFAAAWNTWLEDGRKASSARDDAAHAVLAARYVARARFSRSPIKELAGELSKSEISVRKGLQEARRRGLLSPLTREQGQAGGHLTPRGARALWGLVGEEWV